MLRLIIMLAVSMTLSGTLGQLAGCASQGQDQNYKMLDEDQPMFDTRPDLNQPGAMRQEPRSRSQFVAYAPEAAAEPLQAMEPAGPKPVADTTADVDGRLKTATPDAGDTAETDPDTITQVQDALAAVPPAGRSITGLDRSHWTQVTVGPDLSGSYLPSYFHETDPKTNVWCLVAFERICFAAQVVALPVKMIITPPWTREGASRCGDCCKHGDSCGHGGHDESAVTQTSTPVNAGCMSGHHDGCMQCTCTKENPVDNKACAKYCG